MDTRIDLAVAALVAAFGFAVVAIALTIPDGLYRDAVGPRRVPIGVGILILLCGSVAAIRRARRMAATRGWRAEQDGTEDEPGHPASLVRALVVMALTAAYAASFQPIGYLISTPLYIAAALWAMRERRALKVATIAVVWTAVTYVLFAQVLGVRMPVGPLRTLFREWGLINL